MLKYILFLLSGYYYEILRERKDEIEENIKRAAPQIKVLLHRAPEGNFMTGEDTPKTQETKQILSRETLVITDLPETARRCLKEGWYVTALYHEKNQGITFPALKYGIEDVFALEYRSYEDVYRRLRGLPWDILETQRLKVRESTLGDVEDFYRIYADPSITRYMENLFPQKEEEQAYMQAYIDQIYGFYGYGLWTVVRKDDGRIIGRAGLSVREGYELPELGFVMEVSCQRQGYGLEVCTAILEYAREELSFDRVQALVKEKNLASKKLLERLGFGFERKVNEKEGEYEMYTVQL